jgi:hypothetical protein
VQSGFGNYRYGVKPVPTGENVMAIGVYRCD